MWNEVLLVLRQLSVVGVEKMVESANIIHTKYIYERISLTQRDQCTHFTQLGSKLNNK